MENILPITISFTTTITQDLILKVCGIASVLGLVGMAAHSVLKNYKETYCRHGMIIYRFNKE